jgi:hypothetical protein
MVSEFNSDEKEHTYMVGIGTEMLKISELKPV